jgi:hypothetical protein
MSNQSNVSLVSPLGDPDVSVVEPSYVEAADIPGLTVHLLDNGKWNANYLFSGIEKGMAASVRKVTRSKKFHYSVVADAASLAEIARTADIVVTGVGDCGSCTSCSVHDTVELERLGIPAVLISTSNFIAESTLQADLLGMTNIRIVEIEHPIASRSREYMERLGQQISQLCMDLMASPLATA